MNKQKFKKELIRSNTIVFKTDKNSIFKVHITVDSYSITRNIGGKWSFYCTKTELDTRKLKEAIIYKVFEIIDNL